MDNTMFVKITSHDLYKAIKNYLHNDLGLLNQINKEYIDRMVEMAVTKHIDRIFKDETTISRIIEQKIALVVTSGDQSWYGKNRSFREVILDQIKQSIQEHVTKNLKINVMMSDDVQERSPSDGTGC